MPNQSTPPVEYRHTSKLIGKSSKRAKSINRSSKTSNYMPDDAAAVVVDGRHKRAWKACERCRMKKTKCDGESPCKRCKNDGQVCTAGSRKKIEFKTLPRGYAEILENTHYALIATVQILYSMIRNNESWYLGEPELNDRGQPVIHDIASRLGCIRPSPDLPVAFPECAEDVAELEAQLAAAHAEIGEEDTGSERLSVSLSSSPSPAYTESSSSTERDHATLYEAHNQTWMQQQPQQQGQSGAKTHPRMTNNSSIKPTLVRVPRISTEYNAPYPDTYSAHASFDISASIPSLVYTDFEMESPMLRKASPISWSTGDFTGPPHALNLAARHTRIQQYLDISGPSLGGSLLQPIDLVKPNVLKATRLPDRLSFTDGTIAPHMLDCNWYDPGSQMDSIILRNEYESQMEWA